MNWFKRAQLQETLPYFQEFEEMGEYIPNKENIEAILENQFGASIVSDIGQGDSGVAYLLSNGDVLKITTNSQEGKIAQYFSSNPNPHVVQYHLVWKEEDLYYIVMDRIDKMASSNSEISKTFDYIYQLKEENRCYNQKCSYSLIKNDKFIEEPLKSEILSYLQSLMDIPIKMHDFLNINNVGIKDGNLVFFDIT